MSGIMVVFGIAKQLNILICKVTKQWGFSFWNISAKSKGFGILLKIII